MSDTPVPIPKDILGVPLQVGDCVAVATTTQRGTLVVGNIAKITSRGMGSGAWHLVKVVSQAGRKSLRPPEEVAFISRNPRGP